jgi:type IV pilus assembly protein PilE
MVETKHVRGFSLIELMVAVAIVAILTLVAYPSYVQYIVKGSRSAAQTELQELSSMQEKIYLNSNGFTANLMTPYNATSAGGLGKTNGTTADGKYTLDLVAAGQSYRITATPKAGIPQAADGSFSIASDGTKACGTPAPSWCANGSW